MAAKSNAVAKVSEEAVRLNAILAGLRRPEIDAVIAHGKLVDLPQFGGLLSSVESPTAMRKLAPPKRAIRIKGA